MGADDGTDQSRVVREFGPRRERRRWDDVVELLSFRTFLTGEVKRRFRTRYHGTVLGWMWALINPIITLLLYTLVFGTIMRGGRMVPENPNGIDSYALFLFSGLVVWFTFQQVSTTAIGEFAQSLMLRKRLYFPPSVPVLAGISVGAVGNLVEFAVLVLAFLTVGALTWTFLVFPVLLMGTSMFALGIGMLLAPVNARYRDVGHLYQVVIRILFFMTPIIYSVDMIPETYAGLPVRDLLKLNPLAWYTGAARDLTLMQHLPTIGETIRMLVVAILILWFGWTVFHRCADNVTEEF